METEERSERHAGEPSNLAGPGPGPIRSAVGHRQTQEPADCCLVWSSDLGSSGPGRLSGPITLLNKVGRMVTIRPSVAGADRQRASARVSRRRPILYRSARAPQPGVGSIAGKAEPFLRSGPLNVAGAGLYEPAIGSRASPSGLPFPEGSSSSRHLTPSMLTRRVLSCPGRVCGPLPSRTGYGRRGRRSPRTGSACHLRRNWCAGTRR